MRASLSALTAVALVAGCTPGAPATAPSRRAAAWQVGLYTNDSTSAFEADEAAFGAGQLGLVLVYANYDQSDIGSVGAWAVARGTTLVVAFEPTCALTTYKSLSASQQREYQLDRVAAGDFDSKYVNLADQIAGVLAGSPNAEVWLRYASEMNLTADNTAWAIRTLTGNRFLPGNGPTNFIAAWQHVHHLMAQELSAQGVSPSQLKWVMAPGAHNWPDQSGNTIPEYYPGSAYVDVLGMDGYNWGGSSWRAFSDVFDQGYHDLARLDSNKPIMLAEFASDPTGGDRAAWIQNAAADMRNKYPRLSAFIWFDEGHWQLNDSDGSVAAFAQAFLGGRRVGGGTTSGGSGGGSVDAGAGGCQQDSDCNGGQPGTQTVCNNDNVCATACHSDFDCPASASSCQNWACVAPPPQENVCQQDSDCNQGQAGTQHVCTNALVCGAGCHSDFDCPASASSCQNWACVAPTTTSPVGSTTSGDTSTTGTDADAGSPSAPTSCGSDADCNGGYCFLSTGVCVTGPLDTLGWACGQDSDCNFGLGGQDVVCGNDGLCIQACHSDFDCGAGTSCDVGNTSTCE